MSSTEWPSDSLDLNQKIVSDIFKKAKDSSKHHIGLESPRSLKTVQDEIDKDVLYFAGELLIKSNQSPALSRVTKFYLDMT